MLRNESLAAGRSGDLRHAPSDAESQFALRPGVSDVESQMRHHIASDVQTSQGNSLQSDMLGSTRLDSRLTSEVDDSRTGLLGTEQTTPTQPQGEAPTPPAGSGSVPPPQASPDDGGAQESGRRVKKAGQGMKKGMVQLSSTPRDA